MRVGGSPEKGSEFERKICALLSHWVSKGARKDLFTRNVLSGGQFTVHHARGKKQGSPGDLICSDPAGFGFSSKVLVECKHWKFLDVFSFLRGQGELHAALKKAQKQAGETNRTWMLIVKQNNKNILLFLPFEPFQVLRVFKSAASMKFQAHLLFDSVWLYQFNDFITHIPADDFLSLLPPTPGATSGQAQESP